MPLTQFQSHGYKQHPATVKDSDTTAPVLVKALVHQLLHKKTNAILQDKYRMESTSSILIMHKE